MSEINIEGRAIGVGKPTLVIAEIGVNHDGSLSKALELVRIAAACGADAVKLQFFRAATLVHPQGELAEYQRGRTSAADPIELLRRYEMSGDDVSRIVKAIRDQRMIPLATPFSPTDLELVERLRLPAIKIASPDLINRPLLSAAARVGKPLLVSTGAATMDEVATTVDWLLRWNARHALLHCVGGYPVAPASANLCWIGELARRFDAPVGYSDHTTAVLAGALAAAAGATLVEKHITYDRDARGPDHSSSADPQQFERYVKHVREADALRGAPGKRVLDIEQDVRRVSRQSLVLRRSVKAGDALREEDLTVQRPGTGMSAALIEQAVGRRAARALRAGAMLQLDMLSDAA